MSITSDTPTWEQTVELMCAVAARKIVGGTAFPAFREWVELWVPKLLEHLDVMPAGEAMPAPLVRAMATQLATEIWNQTPLPDNRFRPRKLARPERNSPCPCGSGQKYKRCCGEAPAPSLGITEDFMLAQVLDLYPLKRLKEMPIAELSPHSLTIVARNWMDDGRPQDAATLLEVLFQDLSRLDERAEAAADTLVDAYMEAQRPRKKQRFLDALKSAPDKTLRSAAWQRQAAMWSDGDKPAQAWEAFREAQRLTPNAPSLSHLEVLLLLGQGRPEEARARAQFWIARLQRDARHDHTELIELLQAMTSRHVGDVLEAARRLGDPTAELGALLERLPPPACHYTLKHGGELSPKPSLQAVEDAWDTLVASYQNAADADGVLDFLADHALAGDSFLILQDLSHIVALLPASLPGAAPRVRGIVLQRSEALRRSVLTRLHATDRELPWECLGNRPMLANAGEHGVELLGEQPAEGIELLRWCVEVANPDDNPGLRHPLIHALVGEGRAAEAVAVAARHPDDGLAFTAYGRVLALYAAGRLEEAQTALDRARLQHPRVWKTLLATAPRKPALKEDRYTLGGADEAWIYRSIHLELWRATGALAWATQQRPRRAGGRPASAPATAKATSEPKTEG